MNSINVTLFLAVCSIVLTNFGAVAAQENGAEKVVVIAKVKAPAAATEAILKAGFAKAIPTYQAIAGLEFKAFSLQKVDDANFFGGIYLWKDKASAEKWFSPEWFARVKATYGVEGKVDYYAVAADNSFIPKDFGSANENAVTIFVQDLSQKETEKYSTKSDGLLRSYIVKTGDRFGAILLFTGRATADKFIGKRKIAAPELFNTPVLLDNAKGNGK